MSATTGRPLDGAEHLRQSVADILTTPLGTRVGRRDYGSELFGLVDQAMTPALRLRLFAATAMALLRWEPRLKLTAISLVADAAGTARLVIDGQRTDVTPAARTSLTVPLATA
ncbi:GPW/gp25 family protein [Sphingomonas arantia]|uniref:GPW/gp25 family protein n=1 Tax=Sphingomonas arantia TaxID=1460676 RepID=A0ABW4TWJ7_9SPHN